MSLEDFFGNITPSEPVTCDRYYTSKNRTVYFYGKYEGIPENLAINVIIFAFLLLLFSVLRKIAWDYGRMALVNRAEARWTSLFYGDNASEGRGSQESLDASVHRQDQGICSWIPTFFRVKDSHILQKCGKDALQYIRFQRYLMAYMVVITFFSIVVILPCNFQGNLEGTKQSFGHTTISNVPANSPILWVHTVFAVLYLVIAFIFMRHYSVNLQYEEDEKTTRTLMVFNIPKHQCYKNLLMTHFKDAYPDDPVQNIEFAYNISYLMKLDKHRQWALECLIHSERIYKKTGKRPEMIPYYCCSCCNNKCCKCCKEIDCIDFYSQIEKEYSLMCENEKVRAFKNTLGIAFVTFEDENIASRVYGDFRASCRGAHNPSPSSVSRQLSVHNWEMRFAPAPDNICWNHLKVSPAVWWMKALILNFLLFVIFFFMTTPSVFLNLLNVTNFKQNLESTIHSPLVVHFVPTLILVIMASLLPQLVYYVDFYFIGHWTKSAQHHAIMRKTYIFLLLMIIVLPSLGLTSAKAAVDWLSQQNQGTIKFRWSCIFIPDNGAFFVNYVITTAFIGQALELMRFSELLLFAIKLMFARSAAERTTIRKSLVWEYQFGCQYAWLLCVFSVVVAYSIPCPLITPFGLVYLIMKHTIDRYNIYFAYAPSKIDHNIQTSAVNFVIVAAILLQFCVVFFIILRASNLHAVAYFSITALCLTMLIFVGRICFGWFRSFSPIVYKNPFARQNERGQFHQVPTSVPEEIEEVIDTAPFIAPVLILPGGSVNAAPVGQEGDVTHHTYGTVAQDSSQIEHINDNQGFVP